MAAETLPAASVAVADKVSVPSPIAVTSAAVKLYVQVPFASALIVLVEPPNDNAT